MVQIQPPRRRSRWAVWGQRLLYFSLAVAAGFAIGYGSWRRFWAVEFPLAGPVILAGLRVAAISTISLVTVGILIGVESLGYLFTNGFQRRIIPEILTGVVMVLVIALVIDFLLARLGRLLMPWAPASSRSQRLAEVSSRTPIPQGGIGTGGPV